MNAIAFQHVRLCPVCILQTDCIHRLSIFESHLNFLAYPPALMSSLPHKHYCPRSSIHRFRNGLPYDNGIIGVPPFQEILNTETEVGIDRPSLYGLSTTSRSASVKLRDTTLTSCVTFFELDQSFEVQGLALQLDIEEYADGMG